jgi:putative membrane protein
MPSSFKQYLLGWLLASLGLLAASVIFANGISFSYLLAVPAAGLILTLLNIFIKPLAVIITLPLLLFTRGAFILAINGLMVFLTSLIYTPLAVANFWYALLAGAVVGLLDYLASNVIASKSSLRYAEES